MDTNQVTEHLQVIRTLMERSALYRRALAPIMTYCGVVGIMAGIVDELFNLGEFDRGFVFYWYSVAAVALMGSFFLVRRQALKDSEPFWSQPTRRVAVAMLPPLFIGMFIPLMMVITSSQEGVYAMGNALIMIWALCYGCALHSAGLFISRGFRLFAWIYLIIGFALVVCLNREIQPAPHPRLVMASVFGGIHLVYGIYLYFSENRKTAP